MMGSRLVDLDARSHVFITVCNWIVYLASHNLSFFVLENVEGITKRKKGDTESFADKVLAAPKQNNKKDTQNSGVLSNQAT